MSAIRPSFGFGASRTAARRLVPLLALAAAGCASEDNPSGPSAAAPALATTTLPSFVQVTVGDEHTCAVADSSTAGATTYSASSATGAT